MKILEYWHKELMNILSRLFTPGKCKSRHFFFRDHRSTSSVAGFLSDLSPSLTIFLINFLPLFSPESKELFLQHLEESFFQQYNIYNKICSPLVSLSPIVSLSSLVSLSISVSILLSLNVCIYLSLYSYT